MGQWIHHHGETWNRQYRVIMKLILQLKIVTVFMLIDGVHSEAPCICATSHVLFLRGAF